MVDVDFSPGDTFNKKIRNAQLEQYNYILGWCRTGGGEGQGEGWEEQGEEGRGGEGQ